MREALKFLASEGLIELVPGRGALVKVLTPRDVEEMLQVQTALEVLAARTACLVGDRGRDRRVARRPRRDDGLLRAARPAGVLTSATRPSTSAWCGWPATGSSPPITTPSSCASKRIRFLGNAGPENWRGAVAEHEAMIAALEARDGEALARVVTEHLVRTGSG